MRRSNSKGTAPRRPIVRGNPLALAVSRKAVRPHGEPPPPVPAPSSSGTTIRGHTAAAPTDFPQWALAQRAFMNAGSAERLIEAMGAWTTLVNGLSPSSPLLHALTPEYVMVLCKRKIDAYREVWTTDVASRYGTFLTMLRERHESLTAPTSSKAGGGSSRGRGGATAGGGSDSDAFGPPTPPARAAPMLARDISTTSAGSFAGSIDALERDAKRGLAERGRRALLMAHSPSVSFADTGSPLVYDDRERDRPKSAPSVSTVAAAAAHRRRRERPIGGVTLAGAGQSTTHDIVERRRSRSGESGAGLGFAATAAAAGGAVRAGGGGASSGDTAGTPAFRKGQSVEAMFNGFWASGSVVAVQGSKVIVRILGAAGSRPQHVALPLRASPPVVRPSTPR